MSGSIETKSAIGCPTLKSSDRATEGQAVKKESQVIQKIASKSILRTFVSSKVFKAIILTALTVATVVCPLILPIKLITLLSLTILAHHSHFTKFELLFEASAIYRMMTQKADFHEISFESTSKDRGKIFLGSLPNAFAGDYEKIKALGDNCAILAVLEKKEYCPMGFSQPYDESFWKDNNHEYMQIEQKDHTLLSPDQMNAAADYINAQIMTGENIYIHCRAGVGRSATAVAAYLIKYEGKTVDESIEIIKKSRPKSTIQNKKLALNKFYDIQKKGLSQ